MPRKHLVDKLPKGVRVIDYAPGRSTEA